MRSELNLRHEVESVFYTYVTLFCRCEGIPCLKKVKDVRYTFPIMTFQLKPHLLSLFPSSVDAASMLHFIALLILIIAQKTRPALCISRHPNFNCTFNVGVILHLQMVK